MSSNERGVTLIEIMISLVLLLFVSLAVMQMGIMSMGENVRNSLRDEAVTVAEMRLTEMRSLPFTDAALAATTGTSDGSVSRTVRNASITFNRTRAVSNVDANTKLVTISVIWQLKQQNYTHSVTIILKKA